VESEAFFRDQPAGDGEAPGEKSPDVARPAAYRRIFFSGTIFGVAIYQYDRPPFPLPLPRVAGQYEAQRAITPVAPLLVSAAAPFEGD
jgi:hypothetical protein